MHSAGRVLSLVALALAVLAAPQAHAQPDDARPSTPAALVATVYSATGGSVRWQRSTDDRGAVRGYEVARDGEVLGVFDALSYVDRTLEPGRSYRYRVRAVDSSGQRSARAFVTLETLDARPSAPAALRADVYSSRTAELFWARSGVFGERYLIKRDGREVATTDGTTYIDRSLSTARPYLFEVIALNRQGQRSPSSRLFVSTVRDDGSTPSPALAAPANLRSDVYSRTAAELFWDRSATPGLRYEISRDGEVVGTTDGTSFHDDALASGTTYRYEVVTLGAGRRSSAATVELTTQGGGRPDAGEPVVEVPMLESVFADLIVSLGVYRADRTDVVRVIELADVAVATALASRPLEGQVLAVYDTELSPRVTTTRIEHDCALGGVFVSDAGDVREDGGGSGGARSTRGFRFDQCRLVVDGGESVVDGELFLTSRSTYGSRADDSRRDHVWIDFTLVDADGEGLEIDGRTTYAAYNDTAFNDRDREAVFTRYVVTSNDALVERLDDASFEVFDDLSQGGSVRSYNYAVSGTVTGAATGGVGIRVETLQQIQGSPRELLLRTDDGATLTVTARRTAAEEDGRSVDLRHVGPDGVVRVTGNVAFPTFAAPSPSEVERAIAGN